MDNGQKHNICTLMGLTAILNFEDTTYNISI
jgi:hypothetical protein